MLQMKLLHVDFITNTYTHVHIHTHTHTHTHTHPHTHTHTHTICKRMLTSAPEQHFQTCLLLEVLILISSIYGRSGTSSDNCQETETRVVRSRHAP